MPLKEQYPSKPATSLHLRKTTAYYTRTRVKSSKNCAFLSPNYMYISPVAVVQYFEKSVIFLFKTKMKPQIFQLFQNCSVHHPLLLLFFAMSDTFFGCFRIAVYCTPSFFLIFCHVRHFGIPSFEKGVKMRYYIDILGKLFSQQLISLTSFSWRGAAIKEKGKKNHLPLYNDVQKVIF